jgi:2'-5' RNA ligase
VAWPGVQAGARECATLAARLGTDGTGLGFTMGVPDGTPHLTLTRLDPPADVRRLVGQHVVIAAPLLVGAACLLRSRLGTQGPRYAEIARWRLT